MPRIYKYKRNFKSKLKLRTRLNDSYYYFTASVFKSLIKSGLKQKAFNTFIRAVYTLKLNNYHNNYDYMSSLDIFKKIYFRLNSKIFLKTQHVGRTKHLIPVISVKNSINLANKWFVKSMFLRKERTLYLKLLAELHGILNNSSSALIDKQKYYKLGFKNKLNFKILKFVKN